jgi:hypothetical protein
MQQQRLDIPKGPVPPLRAERRLPQQGGAAGHIEGVDATSGGLIRSTAIAAAAAAAILTFFWLPAEYGVDPTRVGRLLGLTEMGEIKQQLYAEAAAEDAALAAAAGSPALQAAGDPGLVRRLDAIEAQLAGIAAVVGAGTIGAVPAPARTAETPAVEATRAPETLTDTAAAPEPAAPRWRDEVSYTLSPGEGIEVKLVMQEGETAGFEWTANGSVLNYDTHGDGGGNKISYEQGRGVPDQSGTLTAAFTGNHGWFWRNRTDAPARVTLRTRGAYAEMRAP